MAPHRGPRRSVRWKATWQRVEERNRGTARRVDQLGLPEYFAMEPTWCGNPAGRFSVVLSRPAHWIRPSVTWS